MLFKITGLKVTGFRVHSQAWGQSLFSNSIPNPEVQFLFQFQANLKTVNSNFNSLGFIKWFTFPPLQASI